MASFTPCPVCNAELDLCHGDPDVHVNACLDGHAGVQPAPFKMPKLEAKAAGHGSVLASFRDRMNVRPKATVTAHPGTTHRLPHHDRAGPWCPEHKWVMGTFVLVDAFKQGPHPEAAAYILTHFHSDHYAGLDRRWSAIRTPIYASPVTRALAEARLDVRRGLITALELNTWQPIDQSLRIAFVNAHHCPGSVMVIFERRDVDGSVRRILHTGDCRASTELLAEPLLQNGPWEAVYLDTTYCHPKHAFPAQSDTIRATVSFCSALVADKQQFRFCPIKRLVLVGSYMIGKERIAIGVARALGSPIFVDPEKRRLMNLLEWEELSVLLTDKPTEASVHLVSMQHLSQDGLNEYLGQYYPHHATHIVGIRPTGWVGTAPTTVSHAHTYQRHPKEAPVIRKAAITVHSVPYSEHSSFSELADLISHLAPKLVVPTVGNPRDAFLRLADFAEDTKGLLEFWASL